EVIRMFLLSKHYRSPIDYSENSMREVSVALDRIYGFLERLDKAGITPDAAGGEHGPLWADIVEALNDDFNSAKAMAEIFDAVKKGNKLLDDANDAPGESDRKVLAGIYADIRSASEILGIFMISAADYFAAKKDRAMADQDVDSAMIDALIVERANARKSKNFARADEIRDQLQAMKIVLEDGPQGTTWRIE
ncbi:MAG: DALR domain-containing protein, partial [Desulfobacter sp.]